MNPTHIVGSVLYSILIIVSCASLALVQNLDKASTNHRYPTNVFFWCTILFSLSRFVWIILNDDDNSSDFDYVLNRVCFALQFAAFNVIVFFFYETYQNISKMTIHFHRSQKAFYWINGVWFVIQTGFVIGTFVTRGEDYGSTIYDADILSLTLVTLIITMLFLIYGVLVIAGTAKILKNAADKKKFIYRISLTVAIFIVSFSCRVFGLSYRIASKGGKLDDSVFFSFAYFIPDIVPTSWQLFLLVRQRWRSHREHTPATMHVSLLQHQDNTPTPVRQ